MNKARVGLACLLGILVFTTAQAASPPSVNPEQMDLDADLLAKIGKEKSKRSSIADGIKASTAHGGGSGSSDCGTVNINSNTQPKSNSGIREMFGKQSTTIVTGPVINMANCKK